MHKFKIGIIGAGIGGLSIANFLNDLNFDITIFEKVKDLSPVGAGMTLTANAVSCFNKVPLLRQRIIERSAILESFDVYDLNSSNLSHVDIGAISKMLYSHSIGIHRHALQECLIEHLDKDVKLILGFNVNEIKNTDTGCTVISQDREEYDFDLLIAADGINSQVRNIILGESCVEENSLVCYRGITSTKNIYEKKNLNEYWGDGAKFGVIPVNDDQIYWWGVLRNKVDKESLESKFKDFPLEVQKIIGSTLKKDILCHNLKYKKPTSQWFKDSVVFVGDAIHSTLPDLGQGAAMAIESGWVLSELLASSRDVKSILSQYQKIRIRRTSEVTTNSKKISNFTTNSNLLMCKFRNYLSRVTPDSFSQKMHFKYMSESPVFQSCVQENI